MRRQIPTVGIVITVIILVALGIVLIWRFAGHKPIGTFGEFRQQQGQLMFGSPGGMMPAPRPPQQRGQSPTGGQAPSSLGGQ
ncbi:MAG: hypothetical protein N3B10_12215 [Armatimonadetes bacterium]|nr:hypothetical protein [Armatimonadota bacterium]